MGSRALEFRVTKLSQYAVTELLPSPLIAHPRPPPPLGYSCPDGAA